MTITDILVPTTLVLLACIPLKMLWNAVHGRVTGRRIDNAAFLARYKRPEAPELPAPRRGAAWWIMAAVQVLAIGGLTGLQASAPDFPPGKLALAFAVNVVVVAFVTAVLTNLATRAVRRVRRVGRPLAHESEAQGEGLRLGGLGSRPRQLP